MDKSKEDIEKKFILEYFKFSININLFGVAPYLPVLRDLQLKLMNGMELKIDENVIKAIAINVHRLINESYENLAQLLQALIKMKEKNIPLYEYLGTRDENKSKMIPSKSKNINVDTFLEHHGLPTKESESKIPLVKDGFSKIKSEIRKRTALLFKAVSEVQGIHSDLYNTTKHTKSWVSSASRFMGEEAAPNTPMAVVVKDGKIVKKHVSIPCEIKNIMQDIYNIQGITATMRDLLLLFAMKHYPDVATQMNAQDYEEPVILDKEYIYKLFGE